MLLFQSVSYSSIQLYRYEVLRGVVFFPEQSEPLAEMHLDRNDFCDATKLGPSSILHKMYQSIPKHVFFQTHNVGRLILRIKYST